MLALILFSLPIVLSTITINDRSFFIIQWTDDLDDFPRDTVEVVISKDSNLTDRVLYLDAPEYTSLSYFQPFIEEVNNFKENGCLAILTCYHQQEDVGSYFYFRLDDSFEITVGVVPYSVFQYIKSVGGEANITFNSWDKNPWDEVFAGSVYITLNAFVFLLFFINFVYSGYLIGKWIYTLKKIDMNLGFICLVLECCCNMIRVIEMVLCPYHNNFELPALDVLYTVPMAITLISSILIVFFWLDLTSDPFYHGKFLGVMKKPAIVLIIILVVVEIILSVLRTKTELVDFLPVMIYYMIVHCLVVLFNIVAGYRVLLTIKKQKEGRKKLKQIILRIISSGFVTLLGLVVLGAMVTPVMNYPAGFMSFWTLLHFSYFLQSLLLISIFQAPISKKSTTSSVKETTETVNTGTDTTSPLSDRNINTNTE